ncbi:hypothetical protein Tco_1352719 [Tanacetum coccineum]
MIDDLMKKFLNIPQRIDEDYHSIKDDVSLVSVYTTGNVLVRGMLIPDEFLIEEIHVTDDFKKYETVFVGSDGKKRKQTARESISPRKSQKITIKKKKQTTTPIPPPGDDRERDEVAETTILSLTFHKTALAAEAQENIAKVQEKLDKEEIEKMVEEPRSHKEHLENFTDDEEIKKEKQDEEFEKEKKDNKIEKEKNINDVEKPDKVVKEKDIDVATGSIEFRKGKMQTPIPSPSRFLRKVSSSVKTITQELIDDIKILPGSIASICRRRGQIRSHIKNKFITHDFFMGKIREVLDHCNKVVPKLTFAKTNEMINKEIPRLVNLVVNKDREVDPINTQEMISKEFATHAPKMIKELFRKHMHDTTLHLYLTKSSSTAKKSTADLQQ